MILCRWEDLPECMKLPEVKPYYDILLEKKGQLLLKRIFDFIVALVMLIVLCIPMLVISVWIKIDSKGPVFYRQERVTTNGKHFRIHKFRTMVSNADKIGTTVTVGNDSRITGVGSKLRRVRLDELPQLIDVLQGTMSFVGTRPEAVKYVERYKPEYMATLLLPAGITSEAMLGYFKYTNFFISGFGRVFGADTVTLNIILPLGISFYTFSGLAYLIDIYRGTYPAEKNFLNVALYISFFAKITAGPIVRGKDFFPQVKKYRGVELSAFAVGIQIFVFGLFKKIVLADHLGVFVDDVFFAPTAYNTATVILAVISYSLQIYFDFSGYSDMAIGVAKIVGFDFKPNFNFPYLAKGMSDFWKRWHISLSSWFQDYLYIPLGGSRKGELRTYLNLIIVMAVSGLWHGAGITFIVWGVLHGIGSCVSRVVTKSGKAVGKGIDVLRAVATYIVVALLWVVFRASDFTNAWNVWKGMFTIHDGIFQPYTWSIFSIACLLVSTIMAIVRAKKNGEKNVNGYYPILDLSKVIPLAIFFTFCGLTILLGYFGNTAFIYGRF